jgi:hypothetical protein
MGMWCSRSLGGARRILFAWVGTRQIRRWRGSCPAYIGAGVLGSSVDLCGLIPHPVLVRGFVGPPPPPPPRLPSCRQVADAIPIPGLLETLSSSSSGGGGGGGGGAPGGLPLPLPSNEQVLAALAASPAAGLLLGGDTQLVAQATPALEQLSSVVQEVRRVEEAGGVGRGLTSS